MSNQTQPSCSPRPLKCTAISPQRSPHYQSITYWDFPDNPFYLAQLRKMVVRDIPHQALYEDCSVLGFFDEQLKGDQLVAFGTIRFHVVYSDLTNGLPHLYIPALSVKPGIQSFGYGTSVMTHLIDIGTETLRHYIAEEELDQSDLLFLDVYCENSKAIELYRKFDFEVLNPDNPILDPDQDNQPYFVMAKQLAP